MLRAAILSHYDVDSKGDIYLEKIISELNNQCSTVFIITTSGFQPQFNITKYKNIKIFDRPNLGYDFSSYKFGLKKLGEQAFLYDQIILLNDSFYCDNNFSLRRILNNSVGYDLYSITSSKQFAYHLQSYFIIFSKKTITSKFFLNFWSKIYHLKSKLDIITQYEISLTQKSLEEGLKVSSYFKNNINKKNTIHNYWKKIYKKLGLLKIDLVRYKISKFKIEEIVPEIKKIIISHQSRTRLHYQHRQLTAANFVTANNNFFTYQLIGRRKSFVAVILHLYYLELAQEIKNYLLKIPKNLDLFISIHQSKEISSVINIFRPISNSIFIYPTENKGRDVKPFIELFQNHSLDQYDCILKIHSKKSNHSTLGQSWRKEIYSNLLPCPKIIDSTINNFKNDKLLGIVANTSQYLSNEMYWGSNKERLIEICSSLKIEKKYIELLFIAGTMFWFRPQIIKPLIKVININDFEEEKGQIDGTLAHTLERIFCIIAKSLNLKITSIDKPSLLILSENMTKNHINVYDK